MTIQYGKVVSALKKRYTDEAASLKTTPWEVVLFTALTARARDEQVEPVFQELMRRYPTPAKLAKAKQKDVENILKSIGFFRNKARLSIGLGKAVTERFGGVVPRTMDELVSLPGVGRKTASCTLVYAFDTPAIAVDTHVHRIVNRLGWVKESSPPKTEKALLETLPKRYWLDINRVMVQFGRDVCIPGKKPKCYMCPARSYCAYKPKTEAPKK